jgi:hypothetical protein
MYPYLTREQVRSYLPLIRENGVSERALRPDGFTGVYLAGLPLTRPYPGKGHSYARERELFIARHLPQYRSNPTLRRRLALIAWAYLA